MKTTNITVAYDSEKLTALGLYLEKADKSLADELAAHVDALYERCVPRDTREYIAAKLSKVAAPGKSKPKPRPALKAKAIPTATMPVKPDASTQD